MASTSSSSSLPPPLFLAQAGARTSPPRQDVERVTFDIPPFTPPAGRPTEPPAPARPAVEAPPAQAEPPPAEVPSPIVAPPPAPAPAPAVEIEPEPGPSPEIDVGLAEPEPPPEPPIHATPEAETVAYIAQPPAHEVAVHDEHAAGPIDVSVEMFLWTLGTFLLMAWLLTKLAWRPILGALDKREEELREAVDNAEQVRVELETIEEKRSQIILDADTKAKDIVDRGRVAGREAGRVITEKAKQEATIIQENAQRELNAARDKAAADLRQESVDRAIELAEKILEQKLSPAQQKKLTERLIEQI